MPVDNNIQPMPSRNCFLLLGQSNMYGCGTIDKQDINLDDHIQVFRDGKWETAQNPLQKWDCKIYPDGGGSLGISFARELRGHSPQAQINLVPCALGGSPIEKWLPGAECYDNAVNIVRDAIEKGELKAILWHQGENNSLEEDNAQQYFNNFKKVVQAFRKEFDNDSLPFIVGQLGPFIKDNKEHRYSHIVNNALKQVCQELPSLGFVSSEGLLDEDRNDKLHFGMQSLNEFGRRYAKEYIRLLRQQ